MKFKLVHRILERLCRNEFWCQTSPIQHGRQFGFKDGTLLIVFDNGRWHWQGAPCSDFARIEAIIEAARRPEDAGPAAIANPTTVTRSRTPRRKVGQRSQPS